MRSARSQPRSATSHWGRLRRSSPLMRMAGVSAAVVLATSAVVAMSGAAATPSMHTSAPKVSTIKIHQGVIRGESSGGAEAYLGIPYAAPPVGALRFAPPTDPEHWRGVWNATDHAPACLQSGLAEVSGAATSEDCLYLDVYRPGRGALEGAGMKNRGVIVWLHGGAFAAGSGSLFDAGELAARTNSVVVTINYRLGAMGYLATTSQGTDPGNRGLLDQIQALEWVQENIRSFGGDPSRVAVAGQSAGAMSVCGLLTSPKSEGLFSRAILQSGPCTMALYTERTRSISNGDAFADSLGCPVGTDQMGCLRGLEADELMGLPRGFTPTYGVPTVPEIPDAAIRAGRWHQVPVLVGATRWDNLGAIGLLGADPLAATVEQYAEAVGQLFGTSAEAVLERYPVQRFEAPAYALGALATDSTFGCGSYEVSKYIAEQGVPVWHYEFNDPTSPTLLGQRIPGVNMASAHSAELAYLFSYTDTERPLTETERTLAHRMMDSWAGFAASASLPWKSVTSGADSTISLSSLGDHVSGDYATTHHCDFWVER